MNLALESMTAISSKCFILAGKTRDRLEQIDPSQFPTGSSQMARQILLEVFEHLRDQSLILPTDPSVLYKCLLDLQDCVFDIEQSSVNRISWPLVGYCDGLWDGLFANNPQKIFYSFTSEHNYRIYNFSARIGRILNGVLSQQTIDSLLSGRRLFCLQLASVEDYNLPLYANIGHEFGHALFDSHLNELTDLFTSQMSSLSRDVLADFQTRDAAQAERRFERAIWAIFKMAQESFCDVVGAKLMGPAFYLSFFEISWGQNRSIFSISLKPQGKDVTAYPSFGFRLNCIRKWAKVDEFVDSARKDFEDLTDKLGILNCLSTIPVDHRVDRVTVIPLIDPDAASIKEVIQGRLGDLQSALDSFQTSCESFVDSWMPEDSEKLSSREVSSLLKRLEFSVLPNIVPDGTLRGRPASFAAILNASALRRLFLLLKHNGASFHDMSSSCDIVERLTSKALEVSYVQREFKDWSGDE